MLVDPLPFAADSGATNLGSFAATDFAPGASTRVQTSGTATLPGAQSCTLRISHAQTKENPGIESTRSLIRLDVPYVGEDGDGNPILDKASTASVYMVIVHPKDGVATTVHMATLVKGFISGLFASGTEATYDTIKAALDSTYLSRILAGEA